MATINATSAKIYANAFNEALKGNLNLSTSTIKCALITSAVAPTQAQTYFDTAGYTQCTGTLSANYTNGYTLGTKTINTSSLTTTFDAADISQASVTTTGIRYLVLYNDTPASNKPLIAYFDLGSNTDCDGQLTITWNASGIFSVAVA